MGCAALRLPACQKWSDHSVSNFEFLHSAAYLMYDAQTFMAGNIARLHAEFGVATISVKFACACQHQIRTRVGGGEAPESASLTFRTKLPRWF